MKRPTILRALVALWLAMLPFAGAWSAQKVSSEELFAKFQNPEMRYRPFVRWWWNGDAVEAEELIRELHVLKKAGIGGVEINPISLPYGADLHGKKPLKWLSKEWIDMLRVVFQEANRLGMTCDLIVGSGWPFGAESLPRAQRATVMLTTAVKVKGGERLEISQYDLFRKTDPGVTVANQRRVPRLVAAYLTPDSICSLSEAVEVTDKFADGELVIDVPEGPHMLYAMVQYESFASVINGAPGAAGSIVDHMNAAAIRHYLDRMADTIEAQLGPLSAHLRAFFVDSMELEGSNWTNDFRQAFISRRGYDIMPWLPFTMFKVGRLGEAEAYTYGAKKSPDFKERVNRARFDFELTKAELLLERFTNVYAGWCRDKGVLSRGQSYGRGFFLLEPSMAYDIPEGESWTTNWLKHKVGEEMGDADYRRGRAYTMIDKYVSSAAHLTGKRLVSCEEMTNTYLVFNTPLELLKVGSDMSAFSGVTHSVWHGFNYMPKAADFPGWVQYGSYYNEQNTWFPYWRLLNDYRARMSAVLQNVDYYADIAILPPNGDLWTEMGVQTEPFPKDLNVTSTSLIWEAIHKNGGGADYLTESVIEKATVKGGMLCYAHRKYAVIILPEVKGTTQKTLDKLLAFVRSGGKVLCVGNKPDRSLGLKDWQSRDEKVRQTVKQMENYPERFIVLDKPKDGNYLEWYADVMKRYALPHAITVQSPDRFLLQSHYITDDKHDIFLFSNASMSRAKQSEILFPKAIWRNRQAWLYDPATGKRFTLDVKDGKLSLDLGPSTSYFVVFNKLKGAYPQPTLPPRGSGTVSPIGWHLVLHHAREGWTKTLDTDTLVDLKNSTYANFMGDITYTTTLKLSKKSLPRYINLGKVCEIADLKINGKAVGTRWFGRGVFDVSGLLRAGDNLIEVKVTTLMGNYMHTLKDNKVAQRFVIKRKQPLRSMGLIGPVTLYK